MKNYLLIIGLVLIASCGSSTKNEAAHAAAVCVSDTSHKAGSVYLTKDEKNNPVVSWCETDNAGKKLFYLSFFDKASEKFSPAIPVPIEQNASTHEEGMPKVAVKGNGNLVVVYETSSPTKENEYAGAVRYLQSFDRGKTWSQPKSVHADPSLNGSHSFASMARLSNGEIGACWLDATLDYKKGGRPVKFASTSGPSGFGHEVLIEQRACECCRTAIGCDANGNVSIVYRSITDSSVRDIALSTSSDNGKSFSRPISFSNDQWVINGCPHNGPSVANSAKATYATWFTGGPNKGVYYAEIDNENRSTIKKQISVNGRNIQLCLLPDGKRVIAYSKQVHEGSSVYSRIIANKVQGDKIFALNITPEKSHASYPVLSSFGKNKVVLAWTENEKVFYQILDVGQIQNEAILPANPPEYKVANIGISGITLSNTTDPSCGMHLASDVEDTVHVNKKVIGFCSKACKEKYLTASRN